MRARPPIGSILLWLGAAACGARATAPVGCAEEDANGYGDRVSEPSSSATS